MKVQHQVSMVLSVQLEWPRLRDSGFTVLYDNFYPEDLWGKDLVVTFNEIYKKRSRYCVMFVSKEYNEREWTIHERRSAQERCSRRKATSTFFPSG